jgi:prolyl oligopeptidase
MLRSSCIVFAALVLAGLGAAKLQYPPAPKGDTVDTYFGTKVSDPYRSLENGSDPAVVSWTASETKLATDYIHPQPSYPIYAKRVSELLGAYASNRDLHIVGGRFFYLALKKGEQQGSLVVRDRIDGPERTLFDPRSALRDGVEPAIENWYVAPDGSKVAFTTQYGGDENQTLHVVDATNGTLSDTITHVGGGPSSAAVAWDPDAKGFVHTVWPKNADGTYASSGILLVHHALGTDPSRDQYVFGKGLSPIANYILLASPYSDALAIFETDGTAHGSIYMRWNGNDIQKVAAPADGIGKASKFPAAFVGDDLYVVSKGHSSFGEVLAIAPGKTIQSARTVVPASGVVVDDIVAVPKGFITEDIDGGDSAARLFTVNGRLGARLPIPPISLSTVNADPIRGPIMFSYLSYVAPEKRVIYDPKTNTTRPSPIEGAPNSQNFPGMVADRVMVPSLDGKVRIPLEIVHAKSIPMDGTAPTILYAYGAYGTIYGPYYDPTLLAWLERGGVFAQAMIRGGGEYGDAWHNAAHLATKTVSSDDLAACASWLGTHGYGNAKHLGIWGGSAGGFLMGLALTRNPDHYRAVNSDAGWYDLLRFELTPNGPPNTPEFGTVKDPVQFSWMLKQSPYHNVEPGTAYPAILMQTGENDPAVDPYNSRKMVARLQAESSSGYPILLIQRSGQGHGIGDSVDLQAEQLATTYTFFESQLR